jgi:hypothetical protein
MLRGTLDIHTLSRQMGNSAAVIERHQPKLQVFFSLQEG